MPSFWHLLVFVVGHIFMTKTFKPNLVSFIGNILRFSPEKEKLLQKILTLACFRGGTHFSHKTTKIPSLNYFLPILYPQNAQFIFCIR